MDNHGLFKTSKYKRKKKKLERVKKELEEDDIRVEDNPNMYLLLLVAGEIRSLSGLILCFGLAIIGAIVAFGVAILSSI